MSSLVKSCLVMYSNSKSLLVVFCLLVALDRTWRVVLIVISSFILLLPVAIGFIQILCNKSGGVSYSLLSDNSIHDYYKIANNASQVERVKRDSGLSNKTSDRIEVVDKL